MTVTIWYPKKKKKSLSHTRYSTLMTSSISKIYLFFDKLAIHKIYGGNNTKETSIEKHIEQLIRF